MARESTVDALLRLRKLSMLQQHYKHFVPFLEDVMELLGFHVSEIQEDIAEFVAYGPHYIMVQAQRGQAKTTIAAAYCVWCLIHDPKFRVFILSAGGGQATDIAVLVIRIITNMPELECMCPDTTNGDRSSVEHFDVHYTLKGVDKSPSVKCLGITANLQGNRADLILADDIESKKNSLTATMRAQLMELTLDFTSICSTGRIIWLGTPQSQESIYNSLPGRGVTVRVWPGRYPTAAQRDQYGDSLAPMLQRRISNDPTLTQQGGMLGDQGKPIEKEGTGWLDELNLQTKERDQGASWFQLQHMLNTRLVDALRFPLKPEQLVVMPVGTQMPLNIVRGFSNQNLRDFTSAGWGFKMRTPHDLSQETAEFQGVVSYVDPAGGGVNGDETAYATVAFLNGNVFALDVGGIPGGYDGPKLTELAERLARWKPHTVIIEKNMGFGAFREVFAPILQEHHKCAIEDDLVTGQKEKRIIGTLEPVMGRGALIISEGVVEQDAKDCSRYAPKDRLTYSLFHQMAKVTPERGSLVHDDRLDALEGAVRYWQKYIAINQDTALAAQRAREYAKSIEDPLGHNRYGSGPSSARKGSMFRKYQR